MTLVISEFKCLSRFFACHSFPSIELFSFTQIISLTVVDISKHTKSKWNLVICVHNDPAGTVIFVYTYVRTLRYWRRITACCPIIKFRCILDLLNTTITYANQQLKKFNWHFNPLRYSINVVVVCVLVGIPS